MATSLTAHRICCSASRLLQRVELAQSLLALPRHLPSNLHHQLQHHHLPSHSTCTSLTNVSCALRLGSGSSASLHILQRNISTKWFSTSSALPKQVKDNDIAEEEEDSIIPKTDEKGEPLSNWKRMKIMMKAYGYVIIPVHWIIAPVWFGAFYYTIKMGVDIGPFLSKIGVSDHHVESLRNSKASTALMAYALYKIFTPLRYTVTLGATEVTIRKLRKMGYMKPSPPKEKSYRDSFKETVGEMKDKISDMRESKNS